MMGSLVFDSVVGDFHFNSGNLRLDLWGEFSDDVNGRSNRSWLVESGERVVYNQLMTDNGLEDILYSKIIDMTNTLNDLVKEKVNSSIWPEEVDAEGKMIFFNEFDHDTIVVVKWNNGEFRVKAHNFTNSE